MSKEAKKIMRKLDQLTADVNRLLSLVPSAPQLLPTIPKPPKGIQTNIEAEAEEEKKAQPTRWSKEDLETLRKLAVTMHPTDISKHMGRTYRAITQIATKHDIELLKRVVKK